MTLLARQIALPSDLDQRRIERALEARKRYRYVKPIVTKIAGGYRIASPCCSRNIDPEGGIVDVALLQFNSAHHNWHLYRRNHNASQWEFHSEHAKLHVLLDYLNEDSGREFWQ